jgi:hypothetical protein
MAIEKMAFQSKSVTVISHSGAEGCALRYSATEKPSATGVMIDHLRTAPIHIIISDNATVGDLFRAFTTFKKAVRDLAPSLAGSVTDGYIA